MGGWQSVGPIVRTEQVAERDVGNSEGRAERPMGYGKVHSVEVIDHPSPSSHAIRRLRLGMVSVPALSKDGKLLSGNNWSLRSPLRLVSHLTEYCRSLSCAMPARQTAFPDRLQ